MSARLKSDSGISMLELALVLPLTLVLIGGIVDYGFALREVQAISSAAREAARMGASYARLHRKARCADAATGGVTTVKCDTKNADDLKIVDGDSVTAATKKTACQSLRNAKLSPGDWNVNVEVPAPVTEDGSTFDVVTVKIQKGDKAKNCLICWDAMMDAMRGNSESTFALEYPCTR